EPVFLPDLERPRQSRRLAGAEAIAQATASGAAARRDRPSGRKRRTAAARQSSRAAPGLVRLGRPAARHRAHPDRQGDATHRGTAAASRPARRRSASAPGEGTMTCRTGMAIGFLLMTATAGWAAETAVPPALGKVDLEQRLDEQVPLELAFRDETGRSVRL